MKGGDFCEGIDSEKPQTVRSLSETALCGTYRFIVDVRETSKKKIVYAIAIKADAQTMIDLDEKYRILTS